MRGTKHGADVRATAIVLRKDGRCSLDEIEAKTGVPRGTLASWFRKFPLTSGERTTRRASAMRARRKDRGQESKYSIAVSGQDLGRDRKARVAEAAVLFRLALHGFNVFGRVFDGEKTDWLVRVPGKGGALSVQVRWTKRAKQGLPFVSLECADGRNALRRYVKGEFDFIVGYDLFTDTAFVFAWDEVAHLSRAVTVRKDAAERWDKLK